MEEGYHPHDQRENANHPRHIIHASPPSTSDRTAPHNYTYNTADPDRQHRRNQSHQDYWPLPNTEGANPNEPLHHPISCVEVELGQF